MLGGYSLASRQEKFIQNLQNALIRIENKTYGICRVTGKLISKERLKSVPHATLAIEAKLGQNTQQVAHADRAAQRASPSAPSKRYAAGN